MQRWVSAAIAVAALVGAVALLVSGHPIETAIFVVTALAALALARTAFVVHVHLPRASPPKRPVLIYNPWSGGGKATDFKLADEARRRGIEPIELTRDTTLGGDRRGVRWLDGADGLAMAGGDGSQAIVAAAAAKAGVPYACIPAGTRNHFALDLGVDRNDVVGALEAFVDGGERSVDLAEVNGRVFVNNVSLGVYADAVQHEGYRDAKIRTLLDTIPEVAAPEGEALPLVWRDPDGETHTGGLALLDLQQPIPPRAGSRRQGRGPASTRRRWGWRSWGPREGSAAGCCGCGGCRGSRSTEMDRCPPGSTARPRCSRLRSGFRAGRRRCACASPTSTRARRPRPGSPRAPGRAWVRWPRSR